jgi:hypothetical protein
MNSYLVWRLFSQLAVPLMTEPFRQAFDSYLQGVYGMYVHADYILKNVSSAITGIRRKLGSDCMFPTESLKLATDIDWRWEISVNS